MPFSCVRLPTKLEAFVTAFLNYSETKSKFHSARRLSVSIKQIAYMTDVNMYR